MIRKHFANPEAIVSKIKMTVTKKWEEKAEAEKNNSHEKMYQRMVDEAVLLINSRWETNAEYGQNTNYPVDVIEVEAYNAFFITEELKIYSELGYSVNNPETKRCCFFDAFTFTSEEEKQKYIKDVLAALPKGTFFEKKKSEDLACGKCDKYTFKLKISMK